MKKTLFFLLLGTFYWQTAQSQPDSSFIENIDGVTFKMIKVQGGSFQKVVDRYSSQTTKYTIILTDYYIAETEVTQALWRAVMGSDPAELYNKGCNECPVERVSWNEIVNEFLPQLEKRTGKKYRLPTEAEWEYAAKGGQKSKGYEYAGGNNINLLAWYWGNYSQSKYGSEGTTHPVKTKYQNELGLYDMTGNVLEWCQDWYSTNLYGNIRVLTNPVNNTPAYYRVLKGGSWLMAEHRCRIEEQGVGLPDTRYNYNGFRLCISF
ncbi:MAG: formylglycine-generating enzyme family protein [Cytophagales bacterium]|nr:MAG: formylglycine-generating enzyme family protein [Cytophagales bacterium]